MFHPCPVPCPFSSNSSQEDTAAFPSQARDNIISPSSSGSALEVLFQLDMSKISHLGDIQGRCSNQLKWPDTGCQLLLEFQDFTPENPINQQIRDQTLYHLELDT